jgi:hypothetical protein
VFAEGVAHYLPPAVERKSENIYTPAAANKSWRVAILLGENWET